MDNNGRHAGLSEESFKRHESSGADQEAILKVHRLQVQRTKCSFPGKFVEKDVTIQA